MQLRALVQDEAQAAHATILFATTKHPSVVSGTSYGAISAEAYDLLFGIEEPAELAPVRQLLNQLPGRVLEPACGTGRMLVPLRRQGIEIDGADNAPAMLARCHARLDREGLHARLFEQPMQSLDLPFRYKTIFLSLGSVQLVTPQSIAAQMLRCLRKLLLPEGQLLVSTFVPDEELARGADIPWYERRRAVRPADGAVFICQETVAFDRFLKLRSAHLRYEVHFNGRVIAEEHETVQMHWYPDAEFAGMLATAGFEEIALLNPLDASPKRQPGAQTLFRARTPV